MKLIQNNSETLEIVMSMKEFFWLRGYILAYLGLCSPEQSKDIAQLTYQDIKPLLDEVRAVANAEDITY